MRQLLLLLVIFTIYIKAQAPTCASPAFNYCNTKLAATVGLDGQGQQMFKNYSIMYNQFLYLFGQNPGSTAGILQVCNALEVFNDCLVGSGNWGCVSVQKLAEQTDIQNAFFIGGTLGMYQFNCGPGVNTLIHTGLECAQRILNNYQTYLQTCVSTYQSSIVLDKKNGCTYANNLITCWSNPFYNAPCRRAQAADIWWSCEANNVFTSNQFPNCGIDCDAKAGPFINQNSQFVVSHFKVKKNGEHWYKIPNYLEKRKGKIVEVEGAWMNH